MADIQPFPAIRYDSARIDSISEVLTPPYDVISPEEQEAFYQRHPCNFIRLDLGKESPGDTEGNNRYTRAAHFLREWRSSGIFAQESRPALYVYDQAYTIEGAQRMRRAFVSLIRLEPYGAGKIFPHEQTHAGPIADRFQLLKSTKALFSQVFALYPDEGEKVSSILDAEKEPKPLYEFQETHGGHGRVWRVWDTRAITAVQEAMKPKPLFIADGHHRYETSLTYQGFLAQNRISAPGADFITMACVSMADPGLVILPTHRAVRFPAGATLAGFQREASRRFLFRELDNLESVLAGLRHQGKLKRIGVYARESGFGVLEQKPESSLFTALKQEYSSTWRNLDVSILHCILLKDCLGYPEDRLFEKGPIFYTHSAPSCVEQVRSQQYDIAFFLRPSSLNDLQAVVDRGEKMPPKSTFFFPKLMSGLFLYDLAS